MLRDSIVNDLLSENKESEYYQVFNRLFPERDYVSLAILPPDDVVYLIRRFYKIKDPDLGEIINDMLESGDIKTFEEVYEQYLILVNDEAKNDESCETDLYFERYYKD